MKVLVIGGMHGNEPLGISVVDQIKETPIENVTAIIANPEARQANVRFTDADLNRSFSGDGSSYAETRAREILSLCKEFDIVLDFHNTHCPDNDCAFIGETASPLLTDVAGFTDLPRIVVADYDCINKFAPNCISIEISLDSPRNSVDEWVGIIEQLATKQTLPKFLYAEYFSFVYRMTVEDRDNLSLDTQQLRAFQTIDPVLATAMNVQSPAYPIFIGDAYTPYNFGGLLNRLPKD